MPLRVLYYTLHDLALPSAPTTHVRATVGGLQAAGHAVAVVGATSDARATADLELYDCGAFAGHGGLLRRGWRTVAAVRRARAAFRRLAADADVAYARHATAGAVVPLDIPLVYEVNGLLVEELRGDGSVTRRAAARFAERALRRTLSRAQHIVAVSDGLRAETVRGYGLDERRVTTVENGVDTTLIRPGDAALRSATRREWGIPPDARVAGIVGSFGVRQKVEWLLAAWPAVLERFPHAYIVLIGPRALDSGWAAEALRRGFSDRVVCRSAVPETELTAVYAALDVSLQLLASYGGTPQHGSSLKVRAGLAAGRPVISTVHPGLGFLEAERIGTLVPEAEPRALADALIEWFADDDHRRVAGARARTYAETHLDWTIGVGKIEALLQRVVGDGAGARRSL